MSPGRSGVLAPARPALSKEPRGDPFDIDGERGGMESVLDFLMSNNTSPVVQKSVLNHVTISAFCVRLARSSLSALSTSRLLH